MSQVRTFRPALRAGRLYARLYGAAAPLLPVGGMEDLSLAIEEETIKQTEYTQPGGGTRAQVKRVKSIMLSATLQDLSPINLARAVFGSLSAVAGAAITNEAVTAYKGGLIALAHPSPSSVTLKTTGGSPTTIAATGNYEVRPEGLWVFDDAVDIANGASLAVDYTHPGYDVVQALTQAAPVLEMRYVGINEADEGKPEVTELFRVQLGAAKSLGMLDKEFATLQIEGEVLADPTKTGSGTSRFFKSGIV